MILWYSCAACAFCTCTRPMSWHCSVQTDSRLLGTSPTAEAARAGKAVPLLSLSARSFELHWRLQVGDLCYGFPCRSVQAGWCQHSWACTTFVPNGSGGQVCSLSLLCSALILFSVSQRFMTSGSNCQHTPAGITGVYVEEGPDRDSLTAALSKEGYIPVYLDEKTVSCCQQPFPHLSCCTLSAHYLDGVSSPAAKHFLPSVTIVMVRALRC
jgi:hypothetical protein